MDCAAFRDATSAHLDGEDPGFDPPLLDAHRRSCAACAAWQASAERLARQVRVRPADTVPDLVPAIAAQVATEQAAHWWEPAWPWRVTLVVVGLIQIVQGLPAVVFGAAGADHMAHELGAWGVALGAGFLYAAWRPNRAAGLVPFVGALVAFLVVTTTRDIIVGNAGWADELPHLFEAFGLFLLWSVARFAPSSGAAPITGRLRPA
jgi:predicted anti-sigma-YlaC factor YlaD